MNFTKNIFLKNVSILFLGTLISQIINLGGLPILSRLYSTAEFGNLALFMAYGSILFSFSTLQLDLAIVRTSELTERFALIRLSFFAVLFFSLLASLGLFIWSFWNNQINVSFLFLLFIFFIVNGGNQVLIYFFNSEKKYRNIAFARILMVTVNLAFAILLFYWNSEIGLLLSLTLANVFSFFALLLVFGKKIKNVFRVPSNLSKQVLKQNSKFVKFSTPASFLDILSYQIIIILLSEYFLEAITGSFFMAMRIVLLPTALVGNAIGQVFYKEINDKFLKGNLEVLDFWKVWKILFLVGIIPFSLLFFFGEEIFGFVLGNEWILGGKMASILTISGFFIFLTSPTSSGFVVMNQQKYNLVNSSIRVIYTLLFLKLSVWKEDIFFFLWSYTTAEVVMIILYNLVMMKLLKTKNNTLTPA